MTTHSLRPLAIAVLLLLFAPYALSEEVSEMVDKDKNGSKETQVFKERGVITREITDLNNDGTKDSFMYFKRGLKHRREADRNHDGKLDRWYYYDNKGYLLRYELDSNGDGRPDRWTFCEDRLVEVLQEQDRNYDGKVDRRAYNVNVFDRNMHSYRYRRQWAEADNDYDGVIDAFYARKPAKNSKEKPMTDRVGQEMNTSFKTIRPVSANKGGSGSSEWDIVEMLKEKERVEREMGRQAGN